MQRFVALLSNEHMNVVDQAVWALGNIVGDGSECRDFTIRCDIIPPLLALIKPDTKVSPCNPRASDWCYDSCLLFFIRCNFHLLSVKYQW